MRAEAQRRTKSSVPSFTPVRGALLQRKCACGGSPGADGECSECRQKKLQRKAASNDQTPDVPPIVHDVLRSPGQPLDADTRTFLEPRFGHDFSGVRVHTDGRAAESAAAVNSLAYTVGHDVVFGAGHYAPASSSGALLLAHELVHVVQQRAGTGKTANIIEPPDSPLEQEAGGVAREVLAGGRHSAVSQANQQVQRQAAPPQTLGPIIIHPDRKVMQAKQKLVDASKARLLDTGRDFLDEWLHQMDAALGVAPEVEEPDAQKYWWIALAGNLLWAASVLNPELYALNVVMSFVGAAVGSGAVQKLTAEEKPSGKEFVFNRLGEMRDQMSSTLPSLVVDALIIVSDKNTTDTELQNKILWAVLFPGISYEKRFKALRAIALAEIKDALADFMAQFKAWRDMIDNLIMKERVEGLENIKGPIGEPGEGASRASYLFAAFLTRDRSQVEKQHPFRPRLKFSPPQGGGK